MTKEHEPYMCRGCGRPEDECSLNPCRAVLVERAEDDDWLIQLGTDKRGNPAAFVNPKAVRGIKAHEELVALVQEMYNEAKSVRFTDRHNWAERCAAVLAKVRA